MTPPTPIIPPPPTNPHHQSKHLIHLSSTQYLYEHSYPTTSLPHIYQTPTIEHLVEALNTHDQYHIDTTNTQDFTPNDPRPNTRPPPCQTHTITHLVEALNTHDQHIKTLIKFLPDDCAAYNDRGSLVTKRQLLQSTWGELKKSERPPGIPPSHLNNAPATSHYGHSIHHAPHFCHLHGQHGVATRHPKRLSGPSPTTPSILPDHHIQHTQQQPPHNPSSPITIHTTTMTPSTSDHPLLRST